MNARYNLVDIITRGQLPPPTPLVRVKTLRASLARQLLPNMSNNKTLIKVILFGKVDNVLRNIILLLESANSGRIKYLPAPRNNRQSLKSADIFLHYNKGITRVTANNFEQLLDTLNSFYYYTNFNTADADKSLHTFLEEVNNRVDQVDLNSSGYTTINPDETRLENAYIKISMLIEADRNTFVDNWDDREMDDDDEFLDVDSDSLFRSDDFLDIIRESLLRQRIISSDDYIFETFRNPARRRGRGIDRNNLNQLLNIYLDNINSATNLNLQL